MDSKKDKPNNKSKDKFNDDKNSKIDKGDEDMTTLTKEKMSVNAFEEMRKILIFLKVICISRGSRGSINQLIWHLFW